MKITSTFHTNQNNRYKFYVGYFIFTHIHVELLQNGCTIATTLFIELLMFHYFINNVFLDEMKFLPDIYYVHDMQAYVMIYSRYTIWRRMKREMVNIHTLLTIFKGFKSFPTFCVVFLIFSNCVEMFCDVFFDENRGQKSHFQPPSVLYGRLLILGSRKGS